MTIKVKELSYNMLVALNESSICVGRKQNLRAEQMPSDHDKLYIVNFRFDHEWVGGRDARMSVILKPGVLTAWLDVSYEEYDAIPEIEISELDWEAVICVGTPPWTE